MVSGGKMKILIVYMIFLSSILFISCNENVTQPEAGPKDWEGNYPQVNTAYEDYILFASDRFMGTNWAPSVYTMKKDGTNMHAMTTNWSTLCASWSPRRWKIIFVADTVFRKNMGLFIMNYDGTDIKCISHDGENVFGNAAWSPDGQTIAYIVVDTSNGDQRRIKLINPDGTNVRTITDWFSNMFSISWSRDSKRLLFDGFHNSGTGNIFIVNADGSGLSVFFPYPSQCYMPAWSPDGNFVAFCTFASIDGMDLPKIFVYDLKAQRIQQVTSGKRLDSSPAWSPDSKSLIFSSAPPGVNVGTSIFSINLDGTNLTSLTDSLGTDYDVSWYK